MVLVSYLHAPEVFAQVNLEATTLPVDRLVERLRIGSVDGPEDSLHRVSGAAIGPSGEVFVLDAGIPAILVFGRDGRRLRQISRRGQGPGELMAPASWGISGDRIWISDQRLGRVANFSFDGELLSDRRYAEELQGRGAGGGGAAVVHMLEGGTYLAVTPLGPNFSMAERGRPSFRQRVIQVDSTLSPGETVAEYRMESPAISTGGGGFFAFSSLFDGPIVRVGADAAVVHIERRAATASSPLSTFVGDTPIFPLWGHPVLRT